MSECGGPSYSVGTLIGLKPENGKLPKFFPFFSFYRSKCPCFLKHRPVEAEEGKCGRCGLVPTEAWKYSRLGHEYYARFFPVYDQAMIKKEITGILNKIVKDTFHLLSASLMNVVRKVDSQVQLKEAVKLLFHKALQEKNYMDLYASVCCKLSDVVPEGGSLTFHQELVALIAEGLAASDDSRQLRTAEFLGSLYSSTGRVRDIVEAYIKTSLARLAEDSALEGLCKILPVAASYESSHPNFEVYVKRFSAAKPQGARVNFLKMDALDAIRSKRIKSRPARARKKRAGGGHNKTKKFTREKKKEVRWRVPLNQSSKLRFVQTPPPPSRAAVH